MTTSLLETVWCDIPRRYVPSGYEFQRDVSGRISKVTRDGLPKRVKAVKRQAPQSVVPGSVIFSSEAEFGEILLIEITGGVVGAADFARPGGFTVRFVTSILHGLRMC